MGGSMGILVIILIFFILALIVRVTTQVNDPIDATPINDTGFGNVPEIRNISKEIVDSNLSFIIRVAAVNTTIVPIYSATLNMTQLKYQGKAVDWVYQIEKDYGLYTKILPCIIINNGTHYCKE